MNKDVVQELKDVLEENKSCALVTVINSTGSSPARTGQMMLVYPDGTQSGTCGGGAIEYQLAQDALKAMEERKSRQVSYSLSEVQMSCGGSVEAFIDVHMNEKHLIIVGAGHVGKYLYSLARTAGFSITIVEDREAFLSEELYPDAKLVGGPLTESLKDLNVDNSNVVIVTRGHEVDGVALKMLIDTNYRYLGLIGSKRKVLTILEKLKEQGIDATKYENLYAPIGIGIAHKDPAEIAVGILAEIILLKNDGRLEHMRLEKKN